MITGIHNVLIKRGNVAVTWLERKNLNGFLKSALALFLVITMVFALTACKGPGGDDPDAPDDSGDPQNTFDPNVVAPPEISNKPSESNDPEDIETPDNSPSPSPDLTGPDIPLRDEPADDEFFSDAAFMGNSLMNGFELYSGLTTPDYYTATSMSVIGATSTYCVALDNGNSGTMVDGLTQKPYGKIYILLGINEISMNVDAFIESYGAMLDTIRAAQPDCDIYIMGISPVSAAKSSSSEYNMTNINKFNEALYQLAADKGCYYMDLVGALADETGYLPASETPDGVHFSVKIYQIWLEYVRTHYI